MIRYVNGDALEPIGEGEKVIVHVCNDIGGWGRGFVLSLSRKYPRVEQSYRRWYQEQGTGIFPEMKLGETVIVIVAPGSIAVANMIAQRGITPEGDVPPIRYDALEECLTTVREYVKMPVAGEFPYRSVHMPRIGCGLAGGEWSKVEQIINRVLHDVDVYVYDFDTGDSRTIPWKK